MTRKAKIKNYKKYTQMFSHIEPQNQRIKKRNGTNKHRKYYAICCSMWMFVGLTRSGSLSTVCIARECDNPQIDK